MAKSIFITHKVIAAYAEAMLNLLNESGPDYALVRNCHETIKQLLNGVTGPEQYVPYLKKARRHASVFLSVASIDPEDQSGREQEIIEENFSDLRFALQDIVNLNDFPGWIIKQAEELKIDLEDADQNEDVTPEEVRDLFDRVCELEGAFEDTDYKALDDVNDNIGYFNTLIDSIKERTGYTD